MSVEVLWRLVEKVANFWKRVKLPRGLSLKCGLVSLVEKRSLVDSWSLVEPSLFLSLVNFTRLLLTRVLTRSLLLTLGLPCPRGLLLTRVFCLSPLSCKSSLSWSQRIVRLQLHWSPVVEWILVCEQSSIQRRADPVVLFCVVSSRLFGGESNSGSEVVSYLEERTTATCIG